jgi:hypothetical protein
MNKTCLAFLFLIVTSIAGWAQVSTGSIAGQISDPNGALIPDAKVTARNEATGQEYVTQSSEGGLYVFPAVNTGVYTVTVEKTGFKKSSRANVEVRVAQRLDLDARLEVGDLQQTVSVTAEAPLLETTTSERGQNISQKMMNDLPLFTGGIRNPRTFVNYMPGVTNNGEQSVSGSGGRAQEVLIDGGSAINVESSAVFDFPSAEMFSEFKMLQSNFSAEYGRVGGGIEIYVSKSGTNQIHGAAFHNMRRDIWNANAWARNANPNPAQNFRAKERFNETGGSLGGPVWLPKIYDGRNKTFWFFSYSKDLRPVSVAFPQSTVPTAAMKRGDFSEAGVPTIYDPLTRQPFPGNIIPENRFSSISRKILPLIPDPNVSRLTSNYNFVNTTAFDNYIWNVKFDHALTDSNRLSFFYSNEVEVSDTTANFAGPIGNGLKGFQKPFNYRVNHDWALAPNLLTHATVSFSKTRQTWNNPAQNGAGSALGFKLSGDSDAMPRVEFSGPAGLSPYGHPDSKVNNGAQFNTQLQISNGWTWLKGKHEFKMGGAFRKFSTLGQDLADTNGRYTFNRAQTGLQGQTNTGHEFASFLLGAVDLARNVVPPVLFDRTIYYDTSVYLNDNWRITPKLTLNLGVRYEVPIGWHVPGGNGYSHVDINVPNPAAGGRAGALVFSGQGPGRTGVKRFYPTDWSNFGPRLGFAYQLTSKTVLRGGWAIYYQGLSSGGCGCRAGFSGSNNVQSNGVDAAINWDNGIPVQPGYRPPPIIDASIVNFQNVQYQGPTAGQPGRIYNWSFNVQHEVANYLFEVGYQANRGTRLNSTIDLNQLPTSYLRLGSLLSRPIGSPEAQAAGIVAPYAGFPATQSVAQALRPFPQYLGVQSLFAAWGKSWYDSLQTKVERRFGSYQLQANYTWQKTLSQGHYRQVFGQVGSPGATPQDYYNLSDSKSYSNFDVPHILNILSTFDLPFGKGHKFLNTRNPVVSRVVGGWTIAGAQQYRKGTLIWLNSPGNPLGSGVLFAPVTKATLGSGPIRTGVERTSLDPNDPNSRFFNPAAFTLTPAFSLGNAAFYYNDFRQPAVFSENLSLIKRTTLFETRENPVVLTYSAYAFNLFNRTNFGVNGTVGNPNFGRPTGPQQGARIITMGLRLEF